MRSLRIKLALPVGFVAVGLLASAVAFASGGSGKTAARGQRGASAGLAAVAAGPGTAVFGDTHTPASAESGPSGRCLTRHTSAGPVSLCGTTAETDAGESLAVTDECGSSGDDLMRIYGLAPEETAKVRLVSSDGLSRETDVEAGAFLFEGQNPAPGKPYPVEVRWLSGGGAGLGSAQLPVQDGQFCIEPPEAPATP